jgi:bla regulator protein BlaR1
MFFKSYFYILVIFLCLCFTGCHKVNDKKSENIVTVSASPAITASQDSSIAKNTSPNEAKDTEVESNIKKADYSEYFSGLEGCAVFLNGNTDVYTMYNSELCEKRISPCSTFKIIATLMGLEKGIITSADSKMGYDGTEYPMDKWNKDLNLKDAFKESCVWYFRKVIDQVGQSNVQSYLDKLKYGNCNINEWAGSGINPLPVLNGFWLESSLEISPKEQVDILADIFNGETDFSEKNIKILKDIMLTQKMGSVSIYGKTGTGQNIKTKHRDNGWFVGMLENSDERYFFAVHLNDENKEVSGLMAKEVALSIINRYYSESN